MGIKPALFFVLAALSGLILMLGGAFTFGISSATFFGGFGMMVGFLISGAIEVFLEDVNG